MEVIARKMRRSFIAWSWCAQWPAPALRSFSASTKMTTPVADDSVGRTRGGNRASKDDGTGSKMERVSSVPVRTPSSEPREGRSEGKGPIWAPSSNPIWTSAPRDSRQGSKRPPLQQRNSRDQQQQQQRDRPQHISRDRPQQQRAQKQGRSGSSGGGVQRYVPEIVRKFVRPRSGKLLTTPEGAAFLNEHDIEPDNGRMQPFVMGPDLRRRCADASVRISVSPRHFLHPYDLRYFDPRGHPLAALTRSRYALKKERQPLWIMMTQRTSAAVPVVRAITQTRIGRALHAELIARGYSRAVGLAEDREIRGTLWLSLTDPIATAASAPDELGKAIAVVLDEEYSQRL